MFTSKLACIAGLAVLCVAGCGAEPHDLRNCDSHQFAMNSDVAGDELRKVVANGNRISQCADQNHAAVNLPAIETAVSATAVDSANSGSKSQSQANSGRGNGSEGGDPGNSSGKNKGGDGD